MEVFVLWVYALTYLAILGYTGYLFWRHRRAR